MRLLATIHDLDKRYSDDLDSKPAGFQLARGIRAAPSHRRRGTILEHLAHALHPDLEQRIRSVEESAAERNDVGRTHFAALYGWTIALPVLLLLIGWVL
jgi:hypothetical protein